MVMTAAIIVFLRIIVVIPAAVTARLFRVAPAIVTVVTAHIAVTISETNITEVKSHAHLGMGRGNNRGLGQRKRGVFKIAMRLPKREGQLLFPVRQICEAGEEYWSEPVPAGGKAGHPAPILTVTSAAPLAANVSVTGGWFRVLPASVPSGAYFTLHNKSDKSLTLTEMASPACVSLMMHRSVNGGMENVPVLQVAAGETVQFAPGGYHLMCMDAKPVLKPGAQVPVKLRFAGGQVFDAEFAARNAAGK